VGALPRAPRGFRFPFVAIEAKGRNWMEVMPVVNITQDASVKFLQNIFYRFAIPKWVLTNNSTQVKGTKYTRSCADFDISHQASSTAHPHTIGQVECVNGLILQGMRTRMFHDLKAKGRNWHKELPSVLWALRIDVNRATRHTPFHLVYWEDVVQPPEIFLESTRVPQFHEADQDEARELDSNLLEEMCNKALANVQKYQKSLKLYYNKNVVPRQLEIRDLVLK
jgi:transposase InsO family protein